MTQVNYQGFSNVGFGFLKIAAGWGGQRAGFEGHLTIKASDYGFGWAAGANSPVGDEIEITLLIEGVKAK